MMQQQIRTQTPKKNKPAASLIISWLIILGVYLLLRLVFVIFGFHLAPVVLGGCLAVLPYIAGSIVVCAILILGMMGIQKRKSCSRT